MKRSAASRLIRAFHLTFATAACWLGVQPTARAGLSVEMNLVRYSYAGNYYYYFIPNLNTNANLPTVPFGSYYVVSPGYPTNGATTLYSFTTNGFNQVSGGAGGFNDFDAPDFNSSFIQSLTNGAWTIFVTNTLTTNTYYFNVTSTITSNDLPNVVITFPPYGAVNVTNQPTYTWQGPTNYADVVVYVPNNGAEFSADQTSWPSPGVLNQGASSVTVHYDDYPTDSVVCSIPVDSQSHPISSWVSTCHLQDYFESDFTVGTPDPTGTGHTLVAHYPFDATSGPVLSAAGDTSGNGYDMSFGGGFGSQGGANMTSDAAAGIGAVQFHDGDGNSAGYLGWSDPTPGPLLAALAGSFSVSCWIKTTQSYGNDNDPAYYGAGIVGADVPGLDNDVIPLALTGSKIGFNTGGTVQDDTLNSSGTVNDGNYHHVVVTRNQATGQKIIYIDGVLDSFSSGSTNLLSAAQKLTIGALGDASNPDPNAGSYVNGYDGLLDDLQIYSGVLSSNEVASLYASPGATAPNRAAGPGGLVVHYDFDEGTVLAPDVSGNGNNMVHAGDFGGSGPAISSDTVAGAGSVSFDGGSYLTASSNLLSTLAGEFSVSLWLKTSQSFGSQDAPAWQGAGVICADSPNGGAKDVIPVALTGGQVAFNIGDGSFDDTLNSSATVNDDAWHHVVVTRDLTGTRQIYIDGSLDSSEISSTVLLDSPMLLTIGAKADASNPDPSSPDYTGSNGYQGLVDDIQIYDHVLGSTEITFLYNNPGSTIAGVTFSAALGTTNVQWSTSGDTSWFVQSTNTYNGSPYAAQSGSVINSQSSTLTGTVTGPGTLTFYWASQDDCSNFDYEFDIDGDYQADIYCSTPWSQAGPYTLGAGTHTLTWTVYAYGDADPTEAGFLGQVTYVFNPNTAPVITLNPFNQTNYPGYDVALLAAATSNPTATWQWYKVGNPSPIPNATNALFIPTNSGTASVAGSYYAVASNIAGSANSATASVSFANAPLPPDWAVAYKNQVFNNASDSTTNYNIACLLDETGTNIYTVGSFIGTNYFGSDTLITAKGVFGSSFLKQTTGGTAIWGRAMTNNGNGSSYAECMAAAPGGGIYAAGVFSGTNWLGTNKLVDVAGASTYLVRFDAAGNTLWVQTMAGTNANFTEYHDLTSDPTGNVTLSALISGGTRVGTSNVFVAGQQGVLAQFDANGTLRWLQVPSAWPGYLTYSGGCIYGGMGGSATNYIGGVTNLSDRAEALFSINATNGHGNWVRGIAAQSGQGNPFGFSDNGALVAVSGTNVFVAGNAWGSNAVFGPFSVSFPTSKGQYLARYDTDGNAQLATAFGSEYTWPWSIQADAAGDVYIGSDFDTYSIFGSDIIAAPFYETVQSLGSLAPGARIPGQTCVAKFDRNGNPLWARLAESLSSVLNSRDISLASDGVWSCGFFNQQSLFGSITINGAVTCIGIPICTLQYHPSGYLAKIITSASSPSPVTLLNPQNLGSTFQVSFLSQSGFTHAVQYRTNLATGSNWQTYSNVTGDGTLKTLPIPLSVFSPSSQGFVRVSTE